MRVVIIEDEKIAQDFLINLLRNNYPEIEIVAVSTSVKESVRILREKEIDLIFMDIHLKDGDCFSIFEQVEISTPIIFTTAYDEYAIRAFEVNGISYILKPITKIKIENALDKYKKIIGDRQPQESIKHLLLELNREKTFKNRCLVKLGDKIISVDESNFAYFIAEYGVCYLYTKDNNKYIVEYTLDNLYTQLDQKKYFRISRECIANFDSIKEVVKHSNRRYKIMLEPQYENPIVVSYERAPSFISWMSGEDNNK